MSSPAILLVEDDEAIREGLIDCLGMEGYSVHAASNGAEGLAWLRAGHHPRLVMVDLIMPVMGGEEFLQALRGSLTTRGLPVVLMTAVMPTSRSQLPAAEALLLKPFELEDLFAVVQRFVSPPA